MMKNKVWMNETKHLPVKQHSVVPCPVLIVASWPVYRLLRRQVRWPGIPISLRIFHNFFVIHTVKGFNIVNEAEVDVFSGIPLLFLWFKGCWQFDLWFLCLLQTQLVHLEALFMYCWSLAWRILSSTLQACAMSANVQ